MLTGRVRNELPIWLRSTLRVLQSANSGTAESKVGYFKQGIDCHDSMLNATVVKHQVIVIVCNYLSAIRVRIT